MKAPTAPTVLFPKPRRSAGGVVVSVILHVTLILLIVFVRWRDILSWEEVTEMGDPGKKKGGGGGGGSLQVVALPALPKPAAAKVTVKVPPPPPPVIPVPEPVVVVPPPPPTPEPVVAAVAPPDSVPASSTGQGGTGTGGGKGTGTGPGQGSGTGPGSGTGSGPGTGGAGGRGFPPEPRQVILPPLDYPKNLRGRTVSVTFWVGTDGRVERVELAPEIDDKGFSKKFADVMKSYRFRPARSPEGTVIAGTTTVSITF